MTVNKISKYRSEIMGIAILLICICHSTLFLGQDVLKIYDYIRNFCKIGVDIFFIMSGLGLYNSFSRDNNIWRFYKKRLTRILPTYFMVILIWAVISIVLSLESFTGFLWKYSLISFWMSGELVEWFIAAIILLYLVFPILYWLFKTYRLVVYGFWIIIYVVTFYISMTQADQSALKLINEVFVVRIPCFLVGILIGEYISDEVTHKINMNAVILCGISSIVLLYVNATVNSVCERWIERFFFLPCAFCMIVLACVLFDEIGGERKIGLYLYLDF